MRSLAGQETYLADVEETLSLDLDYLFRGCVRCRCYCQTYTAIRVLCAGNNDSNHRDRFFLVGLFSVLDAILDQPLKEIVPSLPLRADIANALLHHEGHLGSALRAVIAYEQHDWMKATCGRLGEHAIRQIYREAMESVLSVFDSLAEQQTA